MALGGLQEDSGRAPGGLWPEALGGLRASLCEPGGSDGSGGGFGCKSGENHCVVIFFVKNMQKTVFCPDTSTLKLKFCPQKWHFGQFDQNTNC